VREAGWFAAALLLVTLGSCEQSTLLADIQKDVNLASETIEAPTFTPKGGVFRWYPPSVTISTPTKGASLFYSTDGSPLVFNNLGQTKDTTFRSETNSFTFGPVNFPTYRVWHTLRALAWRDGKTSGETQARFGIAGDGGVRWAQATLVPTTGRTTGVAQGIDETVYAVGWISTPDEKTQGFLVQLDKEGNTLSGPYYFPAPSKVTAAATDSYGNLYVIGTNPNGFLAKYTPKAAPAGLERQWMVESDKAVDFSGLALFASGASVYALIVGTIPADTVSPVTLRSADSSGALAKIIPLYKTGRTGILTKYLVHDATNPNKAGAVLDAGISSEPAGDDWFQSVAAAPSGAFALVGGFKPATSPINFGGQMVTGTLGRRNPLILSGNASSGLNLNWSRSAIAQGPADGELTAVAINPSSGEVAVAGFQEGIIPWDWGAGKLYNGPSAGKNTVLAAYFSGGNVSGVGGGFGSTEDSVLSALVYGNFNPQFQGRPLYVVGSLASGGASFLIKFSGPPHYIMWTRRIGSPEGSILYSSLATNPNPTDKLVIGGALGDKAVDFGTGGILQTGKPGESALVLQVFD